MVSRKAVALRAGVSQATVTNVFNKSKFVSPDVRQKVLQAAAEVGYHNATPTEFVLIVNDFGNPHYGQILQGMKDTAMKYGAFATMTLLDNDADQICQSLIDRKVSGVFLGTTENEIDEAHCRMLENAGIGFSSSWNDFVINFDTVIRQLVHYLAEMGHRHIVYLSGIKLDEKTNIRYRSFLQTMEEYQLPIRQELMVDGIFPYKTDLLSGYLSMKGLLDRTRDFTAVCAVNDLMALGAMRAIQEAGLSIPDDISIVGCDNIPFAEYSNPPLTTLHIPAQEMGRQIIYSLLQKANGQCTPKIHLQPELIIRKSTGKAKAGVAQPVMAG